MKHPSNTECRGGQTLSKEDFIRYAVLALRDCFVADIRTEKDDTIVLYFVTGERFRLRVSE